MSEVSSRGDTGGWTAQPSVSLNKVAVCEPPTTDSKVLGRERVSPRSILSVTCCVSELPRVNRFSTTKHAFSTDVAVLRGRVSVTTRLDRDNRAFYLGNALAASRGTDGPWFVPGTVGFSRQRGVAAPGLRPQGLAPQASRVSCPRPDRTKGLPPRECRWGTHGFLAPAGDPWGFHVGHVGSDRRVRRPSRTARLDDWTRLT